MALIKKLILENEITFLLANIIWQNGREKDNMEMHQNTQKKTYNAFEFTE